MLVPVNLPDGSQIQTDSDNPIVLLGPNGVGKTRFAVDLAQRNNPNTDRISANRFIGLTDLPRQADSDLKSNTQGALQRQLHQYWDVHNEYTYLMSQILEEDKSRAQDYRAHHLEGREIPKELSDTRLRTITRLWERLFPNRTLKMDYTPTVTRSGSNPYPTAQMSEGERTALYLITRLVSSSASIVIVDEPEIHFHPLLARRFWNEMEAHKKDTLFVYVTHDIPFALSRSHPKIYVVRSPGTFDEIADTQIPDDAINTILGAASFSITATRLIFCEGGLDDEDHRLLKAWYDCPNTAVIPVGGCGNVKQCVDVFNSNRATKNVEAHGHIDRDDWSEAYLTSHHRIKALPINEIEGIVCYEPIFKALAAFYNLTDIDGRYQAFLTAARNSVRGFILNKHALNRAKLLLELEQQQMRNSVAPNADLAVMKLAFSSGVPAASEPERILDQEIQQLTAALNTDELLKKFPAKTYQAGFQHQMQVTTKKAFDDVCAILGTSDADLSQEASKAALKAALIAALEPHLFNRVV
ncbi:hypothetical protein CV770_02380 [Bradyrhizobium sp. AC87j1]|uniref:ATP-dependent nuclease n=1 Tax=Bradyrhizobium sp. AC87j1 TaxID=2055894 RepID=UPI000CECA254|nr:AAA family ATPase [Bradyrhizobium sp. AC87j1]PPQ21102.1 hypothetical protein CV770_02380 [Bradyrhizobium sp. AC87j1]